MRFGLFVVLRDELKLVSRDFSVTLKSIDVGTAVVGKPVNCTLTISDLDPDNGDQILTRFEVRDGGRRYPGG